MLSSRRRRFLVGLLLFVLFFGLYAFSNLTAVGQAAENSWARSYQPEQAIGWHLDHVNVPPFGFDKLTIIVGILAAITMSIARRQWRTLVTVAVATPASILAAQVFKYTFPRPHLVESRDFDVSYPSGHAGIALAITAALLIAMPRRWLRWAAPPLTAWCILVAAGLQGEGQHRASEVIGSALLISSVFMIVGAFTTSITTPVPIRQLWNRRRIRTLAVILTCSAIVGAWNPIPWMVAVYATSALLSLALVAATCLIFCRSVTAHPPSSYQSQLRGAAGAQLGHTTTRQSLE